MVMGNSCWITFLGVVLTCYLVSVSAEETSIHVGMVSIGMYGHIRPLILLAHELLSRDHSVTFYLPDSSLYVY